MITTKILIIDYQAIKKRNFSINNYHLQNHKKYNWEFFMNLTKLAATTVISLSLALSTDTAFSQEQNKTEGQNLNRTEQNLDSVGENLKDAGRSLGNAAENTGEALERRYEQVEEQVQNTASEVEETMNQTTETVPAEIEETATVIKEKSNWGWLGLVGLLGLFGLAGKKEVVVTHREPEISDRTTIQSR